MARLVDQDDEVEEIKQSEFAEPIMLFARWSHENIEKKDDSLKDAIQLNPRWVPHTAGRWQKKRFRKIQCPLVERLTNCLMMHGRNSGKKIKANNIARQSLEIIEVMTGKNPVQVLVRAIELGGPREDSTRVGSAGVVRRQAIDVSPLRRVNLSLAYMVSGARRAAFRNVKTFAECLADEIMLCAENSPNSYAIKKKTETERVAETNR